MTAAEGFQGFARDRDLGLHSLSVRLLGGFRAERSEGPVPDFAWQRRGAKQLTKLLAISPGHALHREQIVETLWPRVGVDSARNSLAKSLYAARQALEPGRPPRRGSLYLQIRDDMIALNADQVLIDADHFQRLAQTALRLATVSAYDEALAVYTGVLLPGDLYEDWPTQRRRYLADLNLRLLLGLADMLAKHGDNHRAIDCLRTALQEDPSREDAHRQLMRLHDAMGARDLALRQFEICRAQLLRELNRAPDWETTTLYEEILANRVRQRAAGR